MGNSVVAHDGVGTQGPSRVVWWVISVLTVLVIALLTGWAAAFQRQQDTLVGTAIAHESRLTAIETRTTTQMDTFDRRLERIEAKIDRLVYGDRLSPDARQNGGPPGKP